MSTPDNTETHFLGRNSTWIFDQAEIHISIPFLIQKDGYSYEDSVQATHICRESIIFILQEKLRHKCVSPQSGGYTGKKTADLEISLSPAEMRLRSSPLRREKAQEFLDVADVVAGIPALLLNPDRRPGDWSQVRTEEEPHWQGIDGAVLHHPVLISIVTGLFRQAWALCRASQADAIREQVPREEVVEALVKADRGMALRLLERARPWIQVPKGGGGGLRHYPIPWYARQAKQVSYWQRFIRLQRSLERYGFDKVFGGDLYHRWGITFGRPSGAVVSGVYAYMGMKGNLTAHHKRVMELGAPRKGEPREEKQVREKTGASARRGQ